MITDCSLDSFNSINKDSIVLIGAGKNAREILQNQDWNIKYAIDSNNYNSVIEAGKKTLPVLSWEEGIEKIDSADTLVITPSIFCELNDKIDNIEKLKNLPRYLYIIMKSIQWDLDREKASKEPFSITCGSQNKIPKTLHYFWFSGDPYPEKVERCLDSWHRYCKDYEFKEWNLDNYISDCNLCTEALKKESWALASDYGRCDVLYKYGGVYLDLDVEVVRPLDDLLYDEGFMCFESSLGVDPGSGMGSIAGHRVMKEICEKYQQVEPYDENGKLVRPFIIDMFTDVLRKYGLKEGAMYQQADGFAVYPPLVFSPYSYMTGRTNQYEKTYAIHHWVSAWVDDRMRKELKERKEYFAMLDNG